MKDVTQQQLDQALVLWNQASEQAQLENNALGVVLQDQHRLIRSMIETGQTYMQASKQMDEISAVHIAALNACFQEVNKRCREYRALEQLYLAQTLRSWHAADIAKVQQCKVQQWLGHANISTIPDVRSSPNARRRQPDVQDGLLLI